MITTATQIHPYAAIACPAPVPTTQIQLLDLFREWHTAKFHAQSQGAITLVFIRGGGFITFFSDCEKVRTEGDFVVESLVTAGGRHDARIDFLTLETGRVVSDVRRLRNQGYDVQLVNAPSEIVGLCYGEPESFA